MNWLAAILALVLILMVHEWGHFLGARAAGMRVLEVALGWGKRLWGTRRGETEYSINALPLLAYVAVDMGEPGSTDPRAARNRSVWGRIMHVAAGPLANMVLAAVLVMGLMLTLGRPSTQVYLSKVSPGSSADLAGLRAGDLLTTVAGQPVKMADQVSQALVGKAGEKVTVQMIRGGRTMDVAVVPQPGPSGQARIGVAVETHFRLGGGGGSFGERITAGWSYFSQMVVGISTAYVQLFSGQLGFGGMSGPIGVVQQAADTAAQGWGAFLMLIAAISVNIGLLNLLPLPALDGGRLVFLFCEAVLGLKIPEEREELVHYVGLMALLGLTVLITVRDVAGLF